MGTDRAFSKEMGGVNWKEMNIKANFLAENSNAMKVSHSTHKALSSTLSLLIAMQMQAHV